MRKERSEIPRDVAGRLMFESDRTCCICRVPGKRLQIHHIDEDPSNHDAANLAALCFDCHDATQVKGGFGRKLDAPQVIQYRDDWHRRVVKRRAAADEVASGRAIGLQIVRFTVPAAPALPGQEASPSGAETDLHKYIKALPAVKREAYRRARELWDTGVTSNQIQGSYDVLDVLTQALVHLASWYPEGHFGEGPVVEYMSSLISSRFVWHRALLESDGAGTGGTIVGPLTAGAVMGDVEDMVVDMVRSLTMDLGAPEDEAEFDFGTWEHQWRRVK